MSIHKLAAGSGYDSLTRQVAALDATAKGHIGMASYYTERSESPAVWVGSGLAGVDGLDAGDAGDAVTGEQMRALFGAGMHPLATQRLERLGDADLTDANVWAATRLGLPFNVSGIAPGCAGHLSGAGLRHFGETAQARRSGQLSGGCFCPAQSRCTPKGYTTGGVRRR